MFIANSLSAATGSGGWTIIGADTLVSLSEVLVAYAVWRGLRPCIEHVFARAVAATPSGLIIGNCVMMGIIGLFAIPGSGMSMEQVITRYSLSRWSILQSPSLRRS